LQQIVSSIQSKTKTMVVTNLFLPNECWEIVFKFLIGNGDIYHRRYMNSLSVVSKQFLHITNHFRFSLIIWNSAHPFLPRLFQRFPNLTTLDLSNFRGDIDALLEEISRFPLKITSLNLSNQTTIPANGLRAFSQNITTLNSLICYNIKSISITQLFLIADCFPLLEELDFSNRVLIHDGSVWVEGNQILIPDGNGISEEGIGQILRRCCNIRFLNVACCSRGKLRGINFEVPKLEVLNLSHTSVNDETLYVISRNCSGLLQLYLERCRGITGNGVMHAVENCTQLREINLRGCDNVNDDDIVASMVLSRPSLKKIIVPPYYRLFSSVLKLPC
jgi:hypothetical protein